MNASLRLSLIAIVLTFSACGQTGELVLPEQAAANKASKAEKSKHQNPLLPARSGKTETPPVAAPAAATTAVPSEPAPPPAP